MFITNTHNTQPYNCAFPSQISNSSHTNPPKSQFSTSPPPSKSPLSSKSYVEALNNISSLQKMNFQEDPKIDEKETLDLPSVEVKQVEEEVKPANVESYNKAEEELGKNNSQIVTAQGLPPNFANASEVSV